MKYDMNDSFDYKRQISCMTLRLLEFFIWILYSAKNKKEKNENALPPLTKLRVTKCFQIFGKYIGR